MNALQQFTYSGQQVRTIEVEGEPWFIASDVAGILDYRMASDMTRRLDADDKGYAKVRTPGGEQDVVIISEAGLYDSIFRSNSEGAKPFRRWVTGSVLPTIRKTGSFHADEAPALPRSFSEALRQLADTCEQLEAVAPKAEAYDALMDADGLYSMQAAAKALGYGPNILFRDLRRLGILQGNNLPYQRYIHHFDVKLGSYRNRAGETVPTTTTMVRPAGLDFLRRKLASAAEEATAAAGSLSRSGGPLA
ncbi:phage antirepressor [Arthrobacter sp. B2a2-09]|uniref:phage antirepressor n=1 Tax=Arthrobacter sp. B2a2-09 TaxID=2952822 RepID=UPI0022CD9B8B|nr:phage antirepressor KilAC domain-containing protein [Arthrobacter sp. B2a2-09]MCZ9884056.1 BRO family protein [Arthrobacter sp. B2a2-09]